MKNSNALESLKEIMETIGPYISKPMKAPEPVRQEWKFYDSNEVMPVPYHGSRII